MRTLVTLGLLAALGCGGGQHDSQSGTVDNFRCKGRRIEYTVAGGLAGVESGISVICREPVPTLRKWRAAEGTDKAESQGHGMTQAAFDLLWRKVESTGWRNMENCSNPGAAGDDPVYTVDISDDTASVSLSCQGNARELPFPFDRLINELDLEAAGFPE